MRTKHKVLATSAAILFALTALTGCAGGGGGGTESDPNVGAEDGGSRDPNSHYAFWQDVPEDAGGGQVLCVWAKSGYGGGLSCDWEGYHAAK